MFVYKLSKSHEYNLEFLFILIFWHICNKFWESFIKDSVFLTKGCKNRSTKWLKLTVGWFILLIIGLIPNLSLCSLGSILNLPKLHVFFGNSCLYNLLEMWPLLRYRDSSYSYFQRIIF